MYVHMCLYVYVCVCLKLVPELLVSFVGHVLLHHELFSIKADCGGTGVA